MWLNEYKADKIDFQFKRTVISFRYTTIWCNDFNFQCHYNANAYSLFIAEIIKA